MSQLPLAWRLMLHIAICWHIYLVVATICLVWAVSLDRRSPWWLVAVTGTVSFLLMTLVARRTRRMLGR